VQLFRTTWGANRHWIAAGFLTSTGLFLLLIYSNWRSELRGMAQQRATGLSAVAESSVTPLLPSFLPLSRSLHNAPAGVDRLSGTVGGVPGGLLHTVQQGEVSSSPAADADDTHRQVIRSGTLEIIATDPPNVADQLRKIAAHLSGFVVNSQVTGSGEQTRSAQVSIRIPAAHFDEARAQVRALAISVEQDTIEARDVTREYVNKDAVLRNSRTEEAQYLAILKRATAAKDVLEISSKLAEVRGRIEVLEADVRFQRNQVEMSLLTTNITATAEARVFGLRWRPLYKAKLSLRGALSGMADYGDSMLELLLNLPLIGIWTVTVLALLKVGWVALRRVVMLFFPGLAGWLRRRAQPQAT
jgi:uncharacterized protein DUF4349